MTTRRMVLATEKVGYLIEKMNTDHIEVIGEEKPGWTVIEISVISPADVLDIFYAGMACGSDRVRAENKS